MDQLDQELDYSNEALRKLGARIRHLRRKRAMTQRDLSFDGCSYSYLARIESGDRRPSPRVLREIASRLGVTRRGAAGRGLEQRQRSRSLEVLDAMMMIRLEQYEQAEELLRGVLREAQVDADAERISEAYEGLGLIAARRGRDETALELLTARAGHRRAPAPGAAPRPLHRARPPARLKRRLRARDRAAGRLHRAAARPARARHGQDRPLHAAAQPVLRRRRRLRQRRHGTGRRRCRTAPRRSTCAAGPAPTTRCHGCTRRPARSPRRSPTPTARSPSTS